MQKMAPRTQVALQRCQRRVRTRNSPCFRWPGGTYVLCAARLSGEGHVPLYFNQIKRHISFQGRRRSVRALLTHGREPFGAGVVCKVGEVFGKKSCGLQEGFAVVQVERIIQRGKKKRRLRLIHVTISAVLRCLLKNFSSQVSSFVKDSGLALPPQLKIQTQ